MTPLVITTLHKGQANLTGLPFEANLTGLTGQAQVATRQTDPSLIFSGLEPGLIYMVCSCCWRFDSRLTRLSGRGELCWHHFQVLLTIVVCKSKLLHPQQVTSHGQTTSGAWLQNCEEDLITSLITFRDMLRAHCRCAWHKYLFISWNSPLSVY